jgi:hypothetical protein
MGWSATHAGGKREFNFSKRIFPTYNEVYHYESDNVDSEENLSLVSC